MKAKTYYQRILTFFFFSLSLIRVVAQENVATKEYNNEQYKFSILVPESWKFNDHMDGADKLYDFLSPDENIFIQVRSFNVGAGLDMDILTKVFKENYIPAGSTTHNLIDKISANGISGKQGNYLGKFNGNDIAISVFYAIENSQGYTLMIIVPLEMAEQYTDIVSAIGKSFIIPGYSRKGSEVKPGGLAGLLEKNKNQSNNASEIEANDGITLSNIRIGDQLQGKTNLLNKTTVFQPDTENIYVVYDWSGKAANQEMKISWYFDDSNYKIDESSYSLPINLNMGSSNGTISRPYEGWPVGNYHVEFSISGQVLKEVYFKVQDANMQESTNDIEGKYTFVSRSDGPSRTNYHFIEIFSNGTYLEKYNPKNSGNYEGGHQGTWQLNGTQLTFTHEDGNIKDFYTVRQNELERKANDVVFIFRK